jgi:coiled-coil domain-containing protein 61
MVANLGNYKCDILVFPNFAFPNLTCTATPSEARPRGRSPSPARSSSPRFDPTLYVQQKKEREAERYRHSARGIASGANSPGTRSPGQRSFDNRDALRGAATSHGGNGGGGGRYGGYSPSAASSRGGTPSAASPSRPTRGASARSPSPSSRTAGASSRGGGFGAGGGVPSHSSPKVRSGGGGFIKVGLYKLLTHSLKVPGFNP